MHRPLNWLLMFLWRLHRLSKSLERLKQREASFEILFSTPCDDFIIMFRKQETVSLITSNMILCVQWWKYVSKWLFIFRIYYDVKHEELFTFDKRNYLFSCYNNSQVYLCEIQQYLSEVARCLGALRIFVFLTTIYPGSK